MNKLLRLTVLAALLVGCNPLKPAANLPIAYYSLSNVLETPSVAANQALNLPTLIVNPPHAAAGFESSKIIYVRRNHQIEYFSQSEWVAPPSRMLAPLIVDAMSRTGRFKAVVLTPSAVIADLRLNTEIIRLQHEFLEGVSPSQVRLTVRAYVMNEQTRKVIVSRDFEAVVVSASENALGGVNAANAALKFVLTDLSASLSSQALQQ